MMMMNRAGEEMKDTTGELAPLDLPTPLLNKLRVNSTV